MKRLWTRTAALLLALVTVLTLLPAARVEAASMKKGSKGTEVRYLQQNLIGLGYLTGEADGSYGSKTQAAVMAFQAEYGLGVDGNAGTATQTAVHNAIIRLQVELKNQGYAPGSADGHFGSKTRKALEKYQKDRGLDVTGVADADTWAKINSESGAMRAGTGVRRTSSATQIRYLQLALIGLGYLSDEADGSYGSKTTEAVRKYQSAYGLGVDGSAGPDTMTSLKNAVVTLQSDLSRKGYYASTIDGSFGKGTTSAVKAYQRYVGVDPTGVAGPATMKKLYGYSLGGTDGMEDQSYKIWIDPLYQDGDYSTITYGGGRYTTTVKESGCGGVALAMALNAMKGTDRYTGQNVMQWFANNGFYWGQGTKHSGIYEYAQELGLKAAYCGTADKLAEHLKKDRVAVALIRDQTGEALFTYRGGGGHYILISGYRVKDGEEQVYVNNPLSYKSSRWFDLEDLMANAIIRDGLENPFIVIYK